MAIFGLEAILCADGLVKNGVWVEARVRAWVGPRVEIGFLFVLRVGAEWALWLGFRLGFEIWLGLGFGVVLRLWFVLVFVSDKGWDLSWGCGCLGLRLSFVPG